MPKKTPHSRIPPVFTADTALVGSATLSVTTAASLTAPGSGTGDTWFGSPTGSPANDGLTSSTAWDIHTALTGGPGGSTVQPGDTVLLVSGDYVMTTQFLTIDMTGTSTDRITVRPATLNGRVTIKGSYNPCVQIYGAYCDIYELESTNNDSACIRTTVDDPGTPIDECQYGSYTTCGGGFVNYGDNNRFWRLRGFNGTSHGMYMGNQPPSSGGEGGPHDVEDIGSIYYYNGYHCSDRDHNMGQYHKNPPDSLGNFTWRHVRYTINFDNFANNFQGNGGDGAVQQERKINFTGNFFAGAGRPHGAQHSNSLWSNIQLANPPPAEVEEIVYDGNWFWQPPSSIFPSGGNVLVGDVDKPAKEFTFVNNRIFGYKYGAEFYYFNGFDIQNNIIHAKTFSSDVYGGFLLLMDKRWASDPDGDGSPAPTEPRTLDFNTYYGEIYGSAGGSWAVHIPSAGATTLAAWRTLTGWDASSTFTNGPPPDRVEVLPIVSSADSGSTPYPGHANIYIWRSSAATTANVNLSACLLNEGQGYEILDVRNLYGAPIITGTYAAASPTVTVSITGTSQTTISGEGQMGIVTPPHWAPELNCFILRPTT